MLPVTQEQNDHMDQEEIYFGDNFKESRRSDGYDPNHPKIAKLLNTPCSAYYGFVRFPFYSVEENDDYEKELVRYMYPAYADHTRGSTQLMKPMPLPDHVLEFRDARTKWPLYRVHLTPGIPSDIVGYLAPVVTAMRLQPGMSVNNMIMFTHHRLLDPEWETQLYRSTNEVLGSLGCFNHTSGFVQRLDPRLMGDYSALIHLRTGIHIWPLTERVKLFRTTCAMNAKNIAYEFLVNNRITTFEMISIQVFKDRLFQESYQQVMNKLMGFQLRRTLVIKYTGQEGVDAGGVLRDWITELSKEFISFKSANYQLFELHPKFGYIVSKFAACTKELLPFFRFFGRFLGICLVHGYNVNINLADLLIKQIKGEQVTARDLAQDKLFMEGLKYVQGMQKKEDFEFTYFVNTVSENVIVNLIPDGYKKLVTVDNRDEYLKKKIVSFIGGDQLIIDAIRQGIDEVLPISWLGLFSTVELRKLMCGQKKRINVSDWIRQTKHIRSTDAENNHVVGWFWQIVRLFSIEAQYRLLYYWTGLGRLPMEGISGVQGFTLHVSDQFEWPFAATCSRRLQIPISLTRPLLFDRLTETIYSFEGFSDV